MTSTIELQIRAAVFTDQVMQTLLATPRPLPAAQLGVQLQRVRFRGVSLRHDQDGSYRLLHVNHVHDQGPGFNDITAKQLQLAVDVTAELTIEQNITANPNTLAPVDLAVEGTLVFDLDVTQTAIGVLALETTVHDLELGIALPSLGDVIDAKAWAVQQLKTFLNLKRVKFDLSSTLTQGVQFWNQGITLDSTGTALVIRAETQDDGNEARWMNFYNGAVPERLGGADWAVVALPADFQIMIQTEVWSRLTQALGQFRVTTVDVEYAGQGNRAAFTITPTIQIWEPGISAFVDHASVSFGMAVGLEDGEVVIDADGSAADDLADGVRAVIAGLVIAFVPLAGWLAAIVLNELLGKLLDDASHALADAVSGADGLPVGTTVEETDRFKYRARVPFTAPSALPGAITTFSADADAVTIGGSWSALRFTPGELVVDTGQFGRSAPFVECGHAGDSMLHAFDADPAGHSTLFAQSALSTDGSAPVSVDAVDHVQVPDLEGTGLSIDDGATVSPSVLPITLKLDAPGGLATSGAFTDPILIDVRTSIGVVRLRWEPFTEALTPQAIQVMRTAIKANLEFCDADQQPFWWYELHDLIPGLQPPPIDFDPGGFTTTPT